MSPTLNTVQTPTPEGKRLAEARVEAAMDAFYPGENWRVDLGVALEGSLRDMRAAILAADTAAQILLTPEGGGLREILPEMTPAQMARMAFNLCDGFGCEFVQANKAFALAVYAEAYDMGRPAIITPTAAPKTSAPGNNAGMREAEFVREIARIADDYHPDHDREAPLALSEMREALSGALAALSPPTGSAGDDETGVREAFNDAALARDEYGFLGTPADCIRFLVSEIGRLQKPASEHPSVAHQPPKAETPAGVGEAPKAATVEWLEKRIDAAERDSNAHPEGHSNRSFYAGQAVAYENVLSFILDRSLAPVARAGDGVERDLREDGLRELQCFVRAVKALMRHTNPTNVNEGHAQQWFAVSDAIANKVSPLLDHLNGNSGSSEGINR